MPLTDFKKYMTVKECAREASVSCPTIRRWMMEGCFVSIARDRRVRLIDRQSFGAFLRALRSPVTQSTS